MRTLHGSKNYSSSRKDDAVFYNYSQINVLEKMLQGALKRARVFGMERISYVGLILVSRRNGDVRIVPFVGEAEA